MAQNCNDCGPNVQKRALIDDCGPLLLATCCGNPSTEYFAIASADPAHEFREGMVVAWANAERSEIKPADAVDDVVMGLFQSCRPPLPDGSQMARVYTGGDDTFAWQRVIMPDGVPQGVILDQLRQRSFNFKGVR